jgi:hypothetical protein
MSAARGDRKPCTRNGCLGTMRFGGEPLPNRPTMGATDGERGWNCSENAEHFQQESRESRGAPAGPGPKRASGNALLFR